MPRSMADEDRVGVPSQEIISPPRCSLSGDFSIFYYRGETQVGHDFCLCGKLFSGGVRTSVFTRSSAPACTI
jgi:hypothetical protein